MLKNNDLNDISALLIAAAALPAGNNDGMKISFSGIIHHGAQALQEMTIPFPNMMEHTAELFDDRLQDIQPGLHAHGLEMLGKHISQLQAAIKNGDATVVRQFFDLYVID